MTNRDELDVAAGEFVMGLASPEEAALAELRQERDPEFRARVAYWRKKLGALDDTAARDEPGEELWRRIEAGIGGQPVIEPARRKLGSPQWSDLWSNLAFWRSAGLAASAASLILMAALGVVLRSQNERPVLIAVLLTDTSRAAAVVNVLADGQAELIPLDSIEVPQGRALQVWTLWDRARGPVSVGLSKTPQRIRLDLGNLPKTTPDQLFEISLEPETGSPTGRPTGPVLMKGTASTPL
jgi:anti-sigma-K factor RskA